jgi:hypothetical protein
MTSSFADSLKATEFLRSHGTSRTFPSYVRISLEMTQEAETLAAGDGVA